MKIPKRLFQRQALIERELRRVLTPLEGSPRILREAMRYCVFSGGKRFRPLLCLGGCEAAGGTLRRALAVACAIELIHTYSLVHDDLPAMDNADERRGLPSCHKRFGEATAILVGDALLTRAFELLSSNGIPNVLTILRTVANAAGTSGLIGGQVLDLQINGQRLKSIVHSSPRPASPARLYRPPGRARTCRGGQSTVKQLEEIARRKTAALITASVVSGGLAGQASSTSLDHLRRYGRRLGLAFQLMDDLHDRDGLVRTLGSDAVRSKAQGLIDQAKRALEPFATRAWVLVELADWLAKS